MRQKWFEDEQEIHLLQRGKRSVLNVVFGRFTVIALLLVLEFVFLFWGAQFLGRYSPVFYVAGRVLAVLCILWLVNRPGNPMPKITWIVLIMALPVFGMLLYLFVQMDVGHRFINHRLQETIAETAEYMPAQQELMERLRTEQPELHGLATYMTRVAASPVYENTAAAAEYVSKCGRNDIAAIGSPDCAELYNLVGIRDDIMNTDNNYTRFICISKELEIYPGAHKTSVIFKAPHRPGALYDVLSKFRAVDINISKLESRPIPGRDFEFKFYIDVAASVYRPELTDLINELDSELEFFDYLGTYTEIS